MSSECPLVILDISRLCRRLFYISHHHCELARGLPAYKAVDLQPQPSRLYAFSGCHSGWFSGVDGWNRKIHLGQPHWHNLCSRRPGSHHFALAEWPATFCSSGFCLDYWMLLVADATGSWGWVTSSESKASISPHVLALWGWSAYGLEYGIPEVTKRNGICSVEGRLTGSSWSNLAQLPEELCFARRRATL